MTTAVTCISRSDREAQHIVAALQDAGFDTDDVSVLFPDTGTTGDFADADNTKAPEGATTGAAAGGALGGLVGWLAGIGSLAIPGVGPLMAAGPILAALSGAGAGAALGGVTGALVGAGIPESEAKLYESRVREGDILIAVHTESAEERALAKEIFARFAVAEGATAAHAPTPPE